MIHELEHVIALAVNYRDELNAARKWREASDIADALDELSHARGIILEVQEQIAKLPSEAKPKEKP